jgi:hypothetical protein
MQESYGEGLASHTDPESCGARGPRRSVDMARQVCRAPLSAVKTELKRRMHRPVPEVGTWLRAVVGGHIRYYGVPINQPALHRFRFQVGWLWHRALSRRSQTGRVSRDRMRRLIDRWLPPAHVCHPYPLRRLGVITSGKSRMREIRSSGSVEGVLSNGHSYSDSMCVAADGVALMSARILPPDPAAVNIPAAMEKQARISPARMRLDVTA